MNFFYVLALSLTLVSCASPKTDEGAVKEAVQTNVETPKAKAPKGEVLKKVEETPTNTPATAGATSGATIVCAMEGDQDQRKISIVTPEGGGCAVSYEKLGTATEVAKASVDMSYCDTVQKKIETNLTSAGYKCSAE